MPKKLSTNPKAEEARERKELQKKTAQAEAQRKAEAELWADAGQSAAEKRAAEREKKREEELKKRAAKKAAELEAEKEAESVKLAKAAKLTQYHLEKQKEQQEKERERLRELEALKAKKIEVVKDAEIFAPNVNKQTESDEITLSGINEVLKGTDALSLATSSGSTTGAVDRHPEKRLRAGWKEYEEKHWHTIKTENPSLKFSQLKDMLWRQWQKAPENPLNQPRE